MMLNHKGTKTIETERLILRQFAMADAEPMFRNWASDDEVTRYLSWHSHRTVAETEAIVSGWVACGIDQYNWAITLKSHGNEPIGSLCITKIDEKIRLAHFGFALGKHWWNRGIMTEALRAILDLGFTKMNLNRIEAMHETDNPASGKVMQHVHMQHEGTLRQRVYNKGRFVDVELYAILRKDYRAPAHLQGSL